MNPSPSLTELSDLSGWFAGAFGAMVVGFLIWVGVIFLGVLGFYWLIRLAVRHGTMDTARWQAAGMPYRGSKHTQAMPVQIVASAAQPPTRPAPRGSSRSDVPVPPRDTLQR